MSENINLKYQDNFLSNVIFKLDFASVPELFSDIPNDIDNLIKESCPTFNKREIIEYQAIIENGRKTDRERRFPVFSYIHEEDKNTITVAHNYITIESSKYRNFTTFKSLIEKIIPTFISTIKIVDLTRIGFRYINQIVFKRGNPFSWTGYIDSSLTSVVDKFFKKTPHTSRAIGQVILNKDDFNINFTYGTPNSEYPAKISRKEFIIDIDCYSNFIETNGVISTLGNFNTEAKILFEKSIKSKLREKMGIINDE